MKLLTIRITAILLLSICLISCSEKKNTKEEIVLYTINKKWKQKKIIIPPTAISFAKNLPKKTAPIKYTIIAFYDGSCTMCYMELKKWEKTMHNYKEIGLNNVAFRFILSGNSRSVVDYYLTELGFPIDLVYYDSKDEFNNKYQFLKESGYKYSSMLLDEKGKILLIGNPTISEVDNVRFLKLIE